MFHNNRFGTEYDTQRNLLLSQRLGGACASIHGLDQVLGPDGPDRGSAGALDELRDVALQGKEAERIMEAAGLDPAKSPIPQDVAVRRAGLIKFLRHLYLVGARGNHQVWVSSTPVAFKRFPHDQLREAGLSYPLVRQTLDDVNEKFSPEVRNSLCEATQLALAWVERAKRTLSFSRGDRHDLRVRRWFGDATTTKEELDRTVAKLDAGFKKMATILNNAMIVITDVPMFRGDQSRANISAFVYMVNGVAEMPRTIYIEEAFFRTTQVSVLNDLKRNWARILVHECSHIEGGTLDHRYAYRGIGVGTDLTAAQAAENADSWAFFAADCAGAMVHGEIARALVGTVPKKA